MSLYLFFCSPQVKCLLTLCYFAFTGPNEPPMLESLSFTPGGSTDVREVTQVGLETDVGCLMCQQQFDVTETQDVLLRHLLQQHKLVIADVKLVANFKKYVISVGAETVTRETSVCRSSCFSELTRIVLINNVRCSAHLEDWQQSVRPTNEPT